MYFCLSTGLSLAGSSFKLAQRSGSFFLSFQSYPFKLFHGLSNESTAMNLISLIAGLFFKKEVMKFNPTVLQKIYEETKSYVNDVLQDSDLVGAAEFNGGMVWQETQWTVTVKDDDKILSGSIKPLTPTVGKWTIKEALEKMIETKEETCILTIGDRTFSLIINSKESAFCFFNYNAKSQVKVGGDPNTEIEDACVLVFVTMDGLVSYITEELLEDKHEDDDKFDLIPVKLEDVTRKYKLVFT